MEHSQSVDQQYCSPAPVQGQQSAERSGKIGEGEKRAHNFASYAPIFVDSADDYDIEQEEDFKNIIRRFIHHFKSAKWISRSSILPSHLNQKQWDFVTNEAAFNGISAIAVTRPNSGGIQDLYLSKTDCVENQGLCISSGSEEIIKPLLCRMSTPCKRMSYHANGMLTEGSGSVLNSKRLPKLPNSSHNAVFHQHRQSLSIYKHRNEIINSTKNNRLTFIIGDTGCGKSTQVPQFILEDAVVENKPIQIVATFPHRITTIFVAERVAAERGEQVGCTVGYQVRLESRVSPCDTRITFCTNEILLRSLRLPDYEILKNTTHIIIDDIHERDHYMDFLLTCLKDLLPVFPNLHIILMGVDICLDELSLFFRPLQYFSNTIYILNPCYPVSCHYLEDIQQFEWFKHNQSQIVKSGAFNGGSSNQMTVAAESPRLNEKTRLLFDELLQNVFVQECKESAARLINFVVNQNIPVNYQHSVSKVPILSCFVYGGFLEEVKLMLRMGADPELMCNKAASHFECFTARDFAVEKNNKAIVDHLLEHQYYSAYQQVDKALQNLRMENHENCCVADHVVRIILEINFNEDKSAAVLVFLKDYDEILEVMDKLNCMELIKSEFSTFVIHSELQSKEERNVFSVPSAGVLKIILCTSVVETSLAFPDIGYVIDSGIEMKGCGTNEDDITDWISKASASQRQAHAGRSRPGKCFRLYTREEYNRFSNFTTPKIRTCSLMPLCLQCRSLIRLETKIAQFFSQVPTPPDLVSVEKCVKSLQIMEALDQDEKLTDLGRHMIDFDIEPQLAKALLFGIVMKCMDPVLTIVATLKHGDPFLNANADNRPTAINYKHILGSKQYSDHYAFVKLFQEWEKQAVAKKGDKFCQQWGLRASTFEKICTTRTLLMGQLRANGFVKNDIRDLNQNSRYWVVVKAVLTAARYPNIAQLNRSEGTIRLGSYNNVGLHPSANITVNDILELKSEWVIFDEHVTTPTFHHQIKGCSLVSAISVALFGGGVFSITNPDNENSNRGSVTSRVYYPSMLLFNLNDKISLQGMETTILMAGQLRFYLRCLLTKILQNPLGSTSKNDAELVKTIAIVLNNEERLIGLSNEDVSQWPKFVGANMMTLPQIGHKSPNLSNSSSSSGCSTYRHNSFQ